MQFLLAGMNFGLLDNSSVVVMNSRYMALLEYSDVQVCAASPSSHPPPPPLWFIGCWPPETGGFPGWPFFASVQQRAPA